MDFQTKETQSQPVGPTTGQPSQPPVGQTMAKAQVLKKFPKKISKRTAFYALASLLVIMLGVGTGWALSGAKTAGSKEPTSAGAPGAETGAKEGLSGGSFGRWRNRRGGDSSFGSRWRSFKVCIPNINSN